MPPQETATQKGTTTTRATGVSWKKNKTLDWLVRSRELLQLTFKCSELRRAKCTFDDAFKQLLTALVRTLRTTYIVKFIVLTHPNNDIERCLAWETSRAFVFKRQLSVQSSCNNPLVWAAGFLLVLLCQIQAFFELLQEIPTAEMGWSQTDQTHANAVASIASKPKIVYTSKQKKGKVQIEKDPLI